MNPVVSYAVDQFVDDESNTIYQSYVDYQNQQTNESSEIKLNQVKWQLVFLSSYTACSNYHYQMMNEYDIIADEYMKIYNLENSKYKPACMPDSKYSSYNVPDDLDLLILVYDKNIGRKELNANELGGLYNHVGTDKTKNHTIIFCDCPSFKFSEPTWILTHELSHFILYYKGFGPEITENLIHMMDTKYDYCIEVLDDPSCESVKAKTTDERLHYSFTVMAPYLPAINMTTIPSKIRISDSPEIIQMQHQVTKWWISGKITDKEYLDSLSILIKEDTQPNPESSYSYFETSKIIFTDPPKEKKSDVNNHKIPSTLNDDKIRLILKRSPFMSDESRHMQTSQEIPKWFKTRAQLWADDEIGNYEFLSGVQYLLTEEIPNAN